MDIKTGNKTTMDIKTGNEAIMDIQQEMKTSWMSNRKWSQFAGIQQEMKTSWMSNRKWSQFVGIQQEMKTSWMSNRKWSHHGHTTGNEDITNVQQEMKPICGHTTGNETIMDIQQEMKPSQMPNMKWSHHGRPTGNEAIMDVQQEMKPLWTATATQSTRHLTMVCITLTQSQIRMQHQALKVLWNYSTGLSLVQMWWTPHLEALCIFHHLYTISNCKPHCTKDLFCHDHDLTVFLYINMSVYPLYDNSVNCTCLTESLSRRWCPPWGHRWSAHTAVCPASQQK